MKGTNNNNILLVGPYYPRKCGIASHIIQLEASLKKDGWAVDILSPFDCEGTYKENLIGGLNPLKLIKYLKNYKKINIHFTPEEIFYSGHKPIRLLNIITLISLYILFSLGKNLNLVIHEPPVTRFFFQRTFLDKLVWNKVSQVTFFTEKECKIFEKKFQINFRDNVVRIEKVNNNFEKFSDISQYDARQILNIKEKKKVFLCIGFINEFKGFDRVALIFSKERLKNSLLYIVGSIRYNNDQNTVEFYKKLLNICDGVENIHNINEYSSYENFDKWIIASDYVVLPYYKSSNSGVLGRAKLFNRKTIVANIGGLSDQVDKDDFIFETDDELRKIIKQIDSANNDV